MRKFGIGARATPRLFMFDTCSGDDCLLGENRALNPQPLAPQLRFSCSHLQLRVLHRPAHFRIRHLQEDGVRCDHCPGLHEDAIDAASRRRRNPFDVFGNEGAGAANLDDHRAASDGVRVKRFSTDARRGRFQVAEAEGTGNDETRDPYRSEGRSSAGLVFAWDVGHDVRVRGAESRIQRIDRIGFMNRNHELRSCLRSAKRTGAADPLTRAMKSDIASVRPRWDERTAARHSR